MSALRHAVRLAAIDVVRMRRKHVARDADATGLLSAAIYAILLVGMTVGGGHLGREIGVALATGELPDELADSALPITRGLLALFWLVATVILAIRAVGQRGTLAEPEGVLTVVPAREALAGVMLAEYAFVLLWLFVPAIGLGAGLAVGAGVVWPVVGVPLAVALVGAASVGLGYPVGLAIRHLTTRIGVVARHRWAIIGAVFVAYFLAISTGMLNEAMVALFEPMQRAPVGWFADVATLGLPGLGPSGTLAAAAIALGPAIGLVGHRVGTRIADRHWFSDPSLAGRDRSRGDGHARPVADGRLERVLARSTAALVRLAWRRARRSPLRLLYAAYPLLFMGGMFAEIVATGQVPAYLPSILLVVLAWAAGVVFTLNPLGDQGAVLPVTLLSRVPGRAFVRAHLIAGLAVAIPVGTVATAAVAALSPLPVETAIAVVVATPIVMVLSAGASVGIGMAFPRFEATTVTRSMKTVLPSKWAFLLFTLYLLATAMAGALVYDEVVRQVVAWLATWALPFGLGVDPSTLHWVALVSFVPLGAVPLVGYRSAVRRYDAYTIA
ncbi:MAG: hypothetical protein ACLFMX_02775 [Halobacteriales archaeon]